MKDLEFLGSGLKIMGIYCFVVAISKVAEGVNLITQYSSAGLEGAPISINIVVLLPIFIILSVGIVLFMFPITVAKTILPRTSADTNPIDFSENVIILAGSTILGIYLLSVVIPDLAFNIMFLYQQHSLNIYENPRISETGIHVVANILTLIISLYLVIGSSGLLRVIAKFRG